MSVNFIGNFKKGIENLHKRGAFLTVKSGDKVNTMTISWGSIGFMWNRPVFTVLVRKSRYTHNLIQNADEFTVSVPLNNSLKDALLFCGTKSGRDIDKINHCGLTLEDGKKISTPIIGQCELHYECKIVYRQPMNPQMITQEVKDNSYSNEDYHTIYYGEIVDCYLK